MNHPSVKIVVTGCSGYVGEALVDHLLLNSVFQVIGIDRVYPKQPTSDRFHFVECDLSAPGRLLDVDLFAGAEAVIHLAAARGDWSISDAEYWRDNVEATRGLLAADWAAQVPNWVFMSSVATYGPSETPLNEDAPCQPIGAYGQSKLASEGLFKSFIQQHGLRGCAIRPSAIFSAGHPANTNVYKLIESLRRIPVPLINGGANRKTLTYLPNLIELVLWSLQRMRSGQLEYATYNYVEEPVQTVSELIASARQSGIRPAWTVSLPKFVALALAYPIYGLARAVGVDLRVTPDRVRKYAASTWYDSTRARRDGFTPGVRLEDALRTTFDWHLGRPGSKDSDHESRTGARARM